MKVLSVLGTRPEAIKMAPVIQELARHSGAIDSRVCLTAQHRELVDDVLRVFGIHPDYDLDLMREGQSPSYVIAAGLVKLEEVMARDPPDWVLVQGDTSTAAAAALAAFHLKLKVGHVEAGLRTGDKWHPFPEEINRRIVDVVADLLFAPTTRARENLLREGLPEANVVVTGNTVVDALLEITERPLERRGTPLERIPWEGKRLLTVTTHRRESFGEPMREVCRALREIARLYDDVHIVLPVHPNPQVQQVVRGELGDIPNVSLVAPLDYVSMAHLMKRSTLILTDSGGIQEEAPSFGVPVLVLRDVTERPEAVEAGAARLVGPHFERILAETKRLLEDSEAYEKMARVGNPFGDGQAARRIVAELLARSSAPSSST